MRRGWESEDLIASWTLLESDLALLSNKVGATRLGFAVLLKFFELEGRFPRSSGEVPGSVVRYVAEQVKVVAAEWNAYDWDGRSIKGHRAQIRQSFSFRECSVLDQDNLAGWLATEVCPVEQRPDQLRDALVARCRAERIEPPTAGRLERVAISALATFEQAFCEQTVGRLSEGTRMLLSGLVTHDAGGTLALIKADPGRVSLETLLGEVGKLAQVTGLGLSALVFTDVSERVLHAWQARAMRAYPSDLRAAAEPVRLTLLAALGAMRQAEITDALVNLLNSLVLKISTRAERRVEGELMADLRRVRNKDGLLFAVADAALARPDDSVRSVVYPVVGEATLRDLVREAKANQQAFQMRVRTVLSGSYSGHYRRMLPHLLGALEFRSNNTAYQPVIQALGVLRCYAARGGRAKFYDSDEQVPPRWCRSAGVEGCGGGRFGPDRTGRLRVVRVESIAGRFAASGCVGGRGSPAR